MRAYLAVVNGGVTGQFGNAESRDLVTSPTANNEDDQICPSGEIALELVFSKSIAVPKYFGPGKRTHVVLRQSFEHWCICNSNPDSIPPLGESENLVGVFRINQLIAGTEPVQSACSGHGAMMCELLLILYPRLLGAGARAFNGA